MPDAYTVRAQEFVCKEVTKLTSVAAELRSEGSVLVAPEVLFSHDELTAFDDALRLVPEERISCGDTNDDHAIYVKRLMTDRAGEHPTLVNRPQSETVVSILDDRRRRSAFAEIFQSADRFFIRRCQLHRLLPGSFVGVHLDVESNPTNEFAVIIQLGRDFEGGDFVVYPQSKAKQVFSPTYGSVLITTCQNRHEVTTVLSSERQSLNYFYSRDSGANARDASEKCSRPNCAWCGPHLRMSAD